MATTGKDDPYHFTGRNGSDRLMSDRAGKFPLCLSKLVLVGNKQTKDSVLSGPIGRLKPVSHFTRIVAKRSVLLCFMSTRIELMIWTQKKMLRYATIRLKWRTALIREWKPAFRLILLMTGHRVIAMLISRRHELCHIYTAFCNEI